MKLGILGGAFDPVHNDHVRLVRGAVEKLGLDGVILLPSYHSPHKSYPLTDYDHRVAMLRLAMPFPDVTIDESEREIPLGKHYSYRMIPILREKYANDELVFLIGGDSLVHFFDWKHPELIAGTIPIWAIDREGVAGEEEAKQKLELEYGAQVKLFRFDDLTGESSREVRAKIALGLASDALPAEVREYIERWGLYGEFRELIEKLRLDLPESLFAHCARTALCAVKYSSGAGVDFPAAFVAAILHDCAKKYTDFEKYPAVAPAVAHQFAGAERAKSVYGIDDEVILDAIRYHTTGRADMSKLGKLVYAADKLEEGRSYPGVEELREAIEADFERGFALTVRRNIEHAIQMGYHIDEYACACYNDYIKE